MNTLDFFALSSHIPFGKLLNSLRKLLLTTSCRTLLAIIFTCLSLSAQGQEAYAVLSGTSLTFYYDNNKASRSGTKYDLSHNSNGEPQWYGKRTSITKVTFDPSFADARPTDTRLWFCEMSKITGIDGLSYLNTSEVTDMSSMFESCTKITSIDLSTFNTENVKYMNSTFYKCTGLTSLDLSAWKLPKLYDMAFMFYKCSKLKTINFNQTDGNCIGHSLFCTFFSCYNLENIDLSHFDVQEVISMNGMCYDCNNLKSIKFSTGETPKLVNIGYAFTNCYEMEVLVINDWKPGALIDLEATFKNCHKLKKLDVSHWDTSQVLYMNLTFFNCNNLEELDVSQWNTSNLTSLNETFYNCRKLKTLDVSHWDTSNVEDMLMAFSGCSSLTSLPVGQFNMEKVKSCSMMFNNCSSLTKIDVSHWNTSNIEFMSMIFSDCTGLQTLDLSGWDISQASSTSLFDNCTLLKTLQISSSFASLDTLACKGVGTMDKPCTVIAPDGFDFYADTDSANYFVWCKGYFRLPSSYMMGDVNNDGSVDISDVILTVNHILGNPSDIFHSTFADMDRDETISISDVVMIVNTILGIKE